MKYYVEFIPGAEIRIAHMETAQIELTEKQSCIITFGLIDKYAIDKELKKAEILKIKRI